MKHPQFGKLIDRIASKDGRTAEIFRRDFGNDSEVLSEHWHEESISVASEKEASDVIERRIAELLGTGVTEAISIMVHTHPKTHQVSRVVMTHLVERKRP